MYQHMEAAHPCLDPGPSPSRPVMMTCMYITCIYTRTTAGTLKWTSTYCKYPHGTLQGTQHTQHHL